MPDRVGVILGELVNINVEYAEQIYLKSEQCPICGFPFKKEYRQNMVNQARSELLKVVLECVPPSKELTEDICSCNRDAIVGWNYCRSKVIEALERVFK